MATISEQETVRFVKENIRPLCEQVRALKVRIAATKTKFDEQINASGSAFNSGANGDSIAENRTSEGVNNLTKLQILQALGEFATIATINDGIISAPCVRVLEAS